MTVGRVANPLCYRYVVNDGTELQMCEKDKDLGGGNILTLNNIVCWG